MRYKCGYSAAFDNVIISVARIVPFDLHEGSRVAISGRAVQVSIIFLIRIVEGGCHVF